MTSLVKNYETTELGRSIITSITTTTGAKSPEEVLEALSKFGIEWYLTEEGTLMIRYWQLGAEGFLSPEQAATIRSANPTPPESNELDWLSKNLQDVLRSYPGRWIAIYLNKIATAAETLPELMNQLSGIDKPFITFIPRDPVVWTFTYAI